MLKSMSRMRNDEGFTLIELLIVIVVIGILASIVLFAVGSAKGDADKSACKAEYKTIQTAQEANKAKNGSYADDEAKLIENQFLKIESKNYDTEGSGTGPTSTYTISAESGSPQGCAADPFA